jgi:hypothetical protein
MSELSELYSLQAASFNRVSGVKGSIHIAAADGATACTIGTFVVQEDSTFTTITGSDGSDLRAILGIGTKTIKAGAVITTRLGIRIINIELATGSIIGYNE